MLVVTDDLSNGAMKLLYCQGGVCVTMESVCKVIRLRINYRTMHWITIIYYRYGYIFTPVWNTSGRVTYTIPCQSSINTISSAQENGTKETEKATQWLLDYCGTHPNATIRYCDIKMTIRNHSDASYLSEPKDKSRVGGYFFLSDKSIHEQDIKHRGYILNIAAVLKKSRDQQQKRVLQASWSKLNRALQS